MRKSLASCVVVSIASGILHGLSWRGETVLLSQIIIEIGGFVGSTVFTQLLAYLMSQIPWIIIETVCCTALYRRFCTASVYYFVRCKKRSRWFVCESMKTMGILIASMVAEFLTCCIAAFCKMGSLMMVDNGAFPLFVFVVFSRFFYYLMFVLVMFAASLLTNGSIGFAFGYAIQIVFIVMLSVLNLPVIIGSPSKTIVGLLNANPMSHIIASWHSLSIEVEGLNSLQLEKGISFYFSNLYLLALVILSWSINCIFVMKREFLIEDPENEGV